MIGIPAAATVYKPPGDSLWAYVRSLMHFNGTDGATTTTDEKGNSWTFHDGSKISTPGKFGAGRLNCTPASGRAWISGPTTLGVFAGDFTVESFIKTTRTDYAALFDKYNGAATGYQMYAENGLLGLCTSSDLGTAASGAINDGAWHHIAWCRSGSTVRAFVDGALVKTWTGVTNNFSSSVAFGIAGQVSSSGTFAAYADFDEFRATEAARYLTAFTPPVGPFLNR